jgi:hypothetical protein
MALYLTCSICGRKQADGLLSRGLWGQLEGTEHGTLRVCPACKERHADWQSVVIESAGGTGATSVAGAGSLG